MKGFIGLMIKKQKFTLSAVFFIVIVSLFGCKQEQQGPEIILSHIDIVVDTVTFFDLVTDEFLYSQFAAPIRDTANYKGQLSYDYYLLGQENFLHFSDQKGFWATQPGSMNFIFQTKKPDMKDSIYIVWKKHANYSLDENISQGPGQMLIEVLPLLNWQNINNSRVIPFISTYSAETYRTMGFGDNEVRNGIDMRQHLDKTMGQNILSQALFKKFTEIDLFATNQEKDMLIPALLACGYREEGDRYTHPVNPSVKITVKEEPVVYKLNFFKAKLSSPVQTIVERKVGRMKVVAIRDEATFTFQ